MDLINRHHFNEAPVMLAAWTGAGNVGILSVDYLRRKLNAHLFAQIDMRQFITPESIIVTGGVAHFPETPQSVFYHHHNPDLVIFESNAHAGGKNDVEVMKAILELAKQLETPRIYTAAALPQSMSHTDPSKMLFATNNPNLIPELRSFGLEPMPDGAISGLNGLMLGFAANRNIDAVCLLATIPAYAGGLTYPRGAMAVVRAIGKLAKVEVDMGDLDTDASNADTMFDDIEGKIRSFFTSGQMDIEEGSPEVDHQEVPRYVMDRIEKLFKVAAGDRSKAQELKSELDKWNLYELYENRFLDLFE
ncbi:MAG: PAC2 family protein [Chitinispirillales bacterium]|jgi:proteasome assembly chaperone (PAC2) family protein|nr:PAC2 family protein [Chitinispirillales bacterium]